MSRVVLHVGPGKTGTSFIQAALTKQRALLADQGWIVPHFTEDSHHEVALSLDAREYVMNVPAVPDLTSLESRQERLSIITEVLSTQVKPDQTWIMSSEYFPLVFRTPRTLVKLRDYFRMYFDEVTPVMYVRRQDGLVPSLFTESAKTLTADRRDLRYDESFLVDRIGPPLDGLGMWRYWHGCFGDEVVARPYLDSWRHSSSSLVLDFVAASGVPLQVPESRPNSGRSKLANQSISATGVAFLLAIYSELNVRVLRPSKLGAQSVELGQDNFARLLRRYMTLTRSGTPTLRHGLFVEDVAAVTPGPSLRLTAELADAIHRKYDADNASLVQQASQAPSQRTGSSPDWEQWLTSAGPTVGPSDQLSISAREVERVISRMLDLNRPWTKRLRSRAARALGRTRTWEPSAVERMSETLPQ